MFCFCLVLSRTWPSLFFPLKKKKKKIGRNSKSLYKYSLQAHTRSGDSRYWHTVRSVTMHYLCCLICELNVNKGPSCKKIYIVYINIYIICLYQKQDCYYSGVWGVGNLIFEVSWLLYASLFFFFNCSNCVCFVVCLLVFVVQVIVFILAIYCLLFSFF